WPVDVAQAENDGADAVEPSPGAHVRLAGELRRAVRGQRPGRDVVLTGRGARRDSVLTARDWCPVSIQRPTCRREDDRGPDPLGRLQDVEGSPHVDVEIALGLTNRDGDAGLRGEVADKLRPEPAD